MTVLTHEEVLWFALTAGFARPDANEITVIAYYESGDNPNNLGDQTLSKYGSIGLTQDFTGAHDPHELGLAPAGTPWSQALVDKLKDPLTNMMAARVIFKEQGLRAWSTYNNLHQTTAWSKLLASVADMIPKAPGVPKEKPVSTKDQARRDKAVASMVAEEKHPTGNWHDQCLKRCRIALGIPAKAPTAYQAWLDAGGAAGAHTHTQLIPESGCPYFFKGSGAAGHIVIVKTPGKTVRSTIVESTDIKRSGRVDAVTIGYIEDHWNMKGLGWSTELNDVQF